MLHTVSLIFTTYAGMDIHRDNGGVVDLAYEYKAPYAFSGAVQRVVFDLRPGTQNDAKQEHGHVLRAAAQQAGVAHGVAG
jgi:hypothetical protein